MPTSRKLKDLTVSEFQQLLGKHDGKVAAVAAECGVTPRALQYWINRNCTRMVVYGCIQGVSR